MPHNLIKFNKGWNCGGVVVLQYKGWKKYILKHNGKTFPGDFNDKTYLSIQNGLYSIMELICDVGHCDCLLRTTQYDDSQNKFIFTQQKASNNYKKSMGFGCDDTADIIEVKLTCLEYTRRIAPIILEVAENSIENFKQSELSADDYSVQITYENYPKYSIANVVIKPDHYVIDISNNQPLIW